MAVGLRVAVEEGVAVGSRVVVGEGVGDGWPRGVSLGAVVGETPVGSVPARTSKARRMVRLPPSGLEASSTALSTRPEVERDT